jgi:hypothetical protein
MQSSDIADNLMDVLSKLKASDFQQWRESIRVALLSMWNQEEISGLEKRLNSHRQQVLLRLVDSLRHINLVKAHQLTQNILQKKIEDDRVWQSKIMMAMTATSNHDSQCKDNNCQPQNRALGQSCLKDENNSNSKMKVFKH